MAQAEANKTAKGKSKAGKKKALDKARKNVKDTSNVVITDAYANHVRVKMAKRGIKSYAELAKICGVSQTTFSRCFGNNKRKSKEMYRGTFNKINKALGIRWG
jgi:DNA invertase Pin-like site-specific DNA recombinase